MLYQSTLYRSFALETGVLCFLSTFLLIYLPYTCIWSILFQKIYPKDSSKIKMYYNSLTADFLNINALKTLVLFNLLIKHAKRSFPLQWRTEGSLDVKWYASGQNNAARLHCNVIILWRTALRSPSSDITCLVSFCPVKNIRLQKLVEYRSH